MSELAIPTHYFQPTDHKSRSDYSYYREPKPTDLTLDYLRGKTIVRITGEIGGDEIWMQMSNGEIFVFYHGQNCCECVDINDIIGDLQSLVGNPLLISEEVNSDDVPGQEGEESFTWTFYKFATIRGHVDIRWYGASNGYYGEGVDLMQLFETRSNQPIMAHREYDFFAAESIISQHMPDAVVATIGMLEDWAGTCAVVMKDSVLTCPLKDLTELNKIAASTWATPTLRLGFKDGSFKDYPILKINGACQVVDMPAMVENKNVNLLELKE